MTECDTPEPALFWSKVNRCGDGCWEWLASVSCRGGYGQIRRRGKTLKAHRLAFYFGTGRWPSGLVCHKCDNPRCCNPEHLYEGTHGDNMRDAVLRARMPWGEGRRDSVLTEPTVRHVRLLRAAGHSYAAIGRTTGLARQHVRQVCIGRLWRRLP